MRKKIMSYVLATVLIVSVAVTLGFVQGTQQGNQTGPSGQLDTKSYTITLSGVSLSDTEFNTVVGRITQIFGYTDGVLTTVQDANRGVTIFDDGQPRMTLAYDFSAGQYKIQSISFYGTDAYRFANEQQFKAFLTALVGPSGLTYKVGVSTTAKATYEASQKTPEDLKKLMASTNQTSTDNIEYVEIQVGWVTDAYNAIKSGVNGSININFAAPGGPTLTVMKDGKPQCVYGPSGSVVTQFVYNDFGALIQVKNRGFELDMDAITKSLEGMSTEDLNDLLDALGIDRGPNGKTYTEAEKALYIETIQKVIKDLKKAAATGEPYTVPGNAANTNQIDLNDPTIAEAVKKLEFSVKFNEVWATTNLDIYGRYKNVVNAHGYETQYYVYSANGSLVNMHDNLTGDTTFFTNGQMSYVTNRQGAATQIAYYNQNGTMKGIEVLSSGVVTQRTAYAFGQPVGTVSTAGGLPMTFDAIINAVKEIKSIGAGNPDWNQTDIDKIAALIAAYNFTNIPIYGADLNNGSFMAACGLNTDYTMTKIKSELTALIGSENIDPKIIEAIALYMAAGVGMTEKEARDAADALGIPITYQATNADHQLLYVDDKDNTTTESKSPETEKNADGTDKKDADGNVIYKKDANGNVIYKNNAPKMIPKSKDALITAIMNNALEKMVTTLINIVPANSELGQVLKYFKDNMVNFKQRLQDLNRVAELRGKSNLTPDEKVELEKLQKNLTEGDVALATNLTELTRMLETVFSYGNSKNGLTGLMKIENDINLALELMRYSAKTSVGPVGQASFTISHELTNRILSNTSQDSTEYWNGESKHNDQGAWTDMAGNVHFDNTNLGLYGLTTDDFEGGGELTINELIDNANARREAAGLPRLTAEQVTAIKRDFDRDPKDGMVEVGFAHTNRVTTTITEQTDITYLTVNITVLNKGQAAFAMMGEKTMLDKGVSQKTTTYDCLIGSVDPAVVGTVAGYYDADGNAIEDIVAYRAANPDAKIYAKVNAEGINMMDGSGFKPADGEEIMIDISSLSDKELGALSETGRGLFMGDVNKSENGKYSMTINNNYNVEVNGTNYGGFVTGVDLDAAVAEVDAQSKAALNGESKYGWMNKNTADNRSIFGLVNPTQFLNDWKNGWATLAGWNN